MDARPRSFLILLLALALPFGAAVRADTLVVNGPGESIQAAIDAALDGDTVLLAPGVYNESLTISGKSLTLASEFLTKGDLTFVAQTVISGAGLGVGGANADQVLRITSNSGANNRVIGLTLQDAGDGIAPFSPVEVRNSRITGTGDGIDFESGSAGSVVADSTFDLNSDDGIDLDGPVSVVIERCEIRDNGDDGIEIRLHDMPPGPTLDIVIRDNLIQNNGEDGIQLIDDTMLTPRVFTIVGNVIADNVDAGLGMMCCQNTLEDFQGAPIPERVLLANNTISGNDHGVTGGANLVMLNNIVVGNTNIGLKNATASSVAAHGLFFSNGIDHQSANVDLGTTDFVDPQLGAGFRPDPGSPAIDAGTAYYELGGGEVVLDLDPDDYFGPAPDFGSVEIGSPVPAAPLLGLALLGAAIAGIGGGVLRRGARRAPLSDS